MRRMLILIFTFVLVSGFSATSHAAQSGDKIDDATPRVCVSAPDGKVTIIVGERVIPLDIDSFVNPGGPDKALCCANCDPGGISCTGCTNLPALSTCHGHILACPLGEILDEDGNGSCEGGPSG